MAWQRVVFPRSSGSAAFLAVSGAASYGRVISFNSNGSSRRWSSACMTWFVSRFCCWVSFNSIGARLVMRRYGLGFDFQSLQSLRLSVPRRWIWWIFVSCGGHVTFKSQTCVLKIVVLWFVVAKLYLSKVISRGFNNLMFSTNWRKLWNNCFSDSFTIYFMAFCKSNNYVK